MTSSAGIFLKTGYAPLALNRYAAIAWQGERLRMWMWNRQYIDSASGPIMQTVEVTELREAALRYWRDRWVPLEWDSALLRRMEDALRGHRGLKREGVSFPDGPFLPEPEALPRASGGG